MEISLIVAVDKNGLMGLDNKLPWHLPNDLNFFKEMTSDYPLIMGRKTYESIGKALPNRKNIVISRNPIYNLKDAITVTNINDAILIAKMTKKNNCFIIGGKEIFNLALNNELIDTLYISIIDTIIEYNSNQNPIYFNMNHIDKWDLKEIKITKQDIKNKHRIQFLKFKKY